MLHIFTSLMLNELTQLIHIKSKEVKLLTLKDAARSITDLE